MADKENISPNLAAKRPTKKETQEANLELTVARNGYAFQRQIEWLILPKKKRWQSLDCAMGPCYLECILLVPWETKGGGQNLLGTTQMSNLTDIINGVLAQAGVTHARASMPKT